MAFLSPYPPDGRYREDDIYQQRSARSTPFEAPALLNDPTSPEVGLTSPPAANVPRKKIALSDPTAFRYLEDDPSVTVVERRRVLPGYELYLVEQWACSRLSPILVIATYTGDSKHSVVVGVLSVPADDNQWSPKLRAYFKATQQYHARPKDTEYGEMMITNLSSFPSALTVIPVPDGDIRKHRQIFIVNENLKRLGCLGRSGLTLTHPNNASEAKFQQLYKVSERVPFSQAVTELVKLCQVALFLFEKLDQEYIDGLLCDVTETAIGNWWTEVGAEHYNFEPTDGILGPSTVAALLGMLMGARNRLSWYGAPVSKDVFDIESTKRGIAHFQRSQKLERTRRLDRQTIFRLHTVTAKAAAGEGWRMQKAVKSTMTEIGGKRGEIVMGMVSGKEKAGLAEIETLDYDSFVSLVYGERPKWLWHGKARRSVADPEENSISTGREDRSSQGLRRVQTAAGDEEASDAKRKDEPFIVTSPLAHSTSANSAVDAHGEKDPLRKAVLKSVAGKMSDARSGFGRIKDAVGGGLRGHAPRLSITTKDEMLDTSGSSGTLKDTNSPVAPGRAFTWKQKPEEYLNAMRQGETDQVGLPALDGNDDSYSATPDTAVQQSCEEEKKKAAEIQVALETIGLEVRKNAVPRVPSAVRSKIDESELRGGILEAEKKADPARLALARRHSVDVGWLVLHHAPNENRWPRRMSFGDAEEAVLGWDELIEITASPGGAGDIGAMEEVAQHLKDSIAGILRDVEPWVEDKLRMVEIVNEQYAKEHQTLQQLYTQLSEACYRIKNNSEELLASERAQLTGSVKEVEALVARLEYEINALVQKVNDVEDGIQSFERQVVDVEKRAEELKKQLETESWLHWLVRTLTGVGTGPNITRSS